MVRYFYAWLPLVIVTAVFVLSMPWLGLIALMIGALVALLTLMALAWVVVFVPCMLGRAISRRWHRRYGVSPRTVPALSPASHDNDPVWQGAPSHPAPLSVGRELHPPRHIFRGGHDS
jgi:hypothetical protein